MISKKSIISTAIVSGSVFAITLGAASIALANNDSTNLQFGNKAFILAQAHQHGQEKGSGQGGDSKQNEGQQGEGGKHRHGQDKKSEHGNHKEGESKGGHGKDKGEGDKHGDMKKGGHDYAHMVMSHTDALKLSDEQLGKIVRLHLKNEKEHEQLKEKLKESMQTFKKDSMKPGTSDAQLHKLGKDHTDAFNAMVEYHIKERQAIHSVLSEDQKKQLNAMKMDHDHDSHDDKQGGHGGH